MEKLKNIISQYVDVNPLLIDENMSLNAELGLDSFALISMLVEIEESFNVEIPDYELPNFQTLKDLYSYVSKDSAIVNA